MEAFQSCRWPINQASYKDLGDQAGRSGVEDFPQSLHPQMTESQSLSAYLDAIHHHRVSWLMVSQFSEHQGES